MCITSFTCCQGIISRQSLHGSFGGFRGTEAFNVSEATKSKSSGLPGLLNSIKKDSGGACWLVALAIIFSQGGILPAFQAIPLGFQGLPFSADTFVVSLRSPLGPGSLALARFIHSVAILCRMSSSVLPVTGRLSALSLEPCQHRVGTTASIAEVLHKVTTSLLLTKSKICRNVALFMADAQYILSIRLFVPKWPAHENEPSSFRPFFILSSSDQLLAEAGKRPTYQHPSDTLSFP